MISPSLNCAWHRVECKPHANADKLLVLQIDLGGEKRQICAGLRSTISRNSSSASRSLSSPISPAHDARRDQPRHAAGGNRRADAGRDHRLPVRPAAAGSKSAEPRRAEMSDLDNQSRQKPSPPGRWDPYIVFAVTAASFRSSRLGFRVAIWRRESSSSGQSFADWQPSPCRT